MIGNINVKDIAPNELMRNISFVFQNTKLFKTTLLENIKYGNPTATLPEIEKAVDMAQCREIIDKLPLGLNTKIGSEGTYLSGGEQQRIVLARAFLKNAPIIVLDEATAFADPENEHLIQQALKELTKGKTVLMIAHRLSSITDGLRRPVLRQRQATPSVRRHSRAFRNRRTANAFRRLPFVPISRRFPHEWPHEPLPRRLTSAYFEVRATTVVQFLPGRLSRSGAITAKGTGF